LVSLGLILIYILTYKKELSFGKRLGNIDNVWVYSSFHKKELNKYSQLESVYIVPPGLKSGLKWECVEFVRRYLILTHNVTFRHVDFAYEIFNLDCFTSTINRKKVRINKIINGMNRPKKGSIIIWDRHVTRDNTGHVAIVVRKTHNKIFIAEQNWDNISWNGKNYSRILPIYNNFINDPHIIGWIDMMD
jgi:glutathionylspermidine amidase/synthetase